ncbi:hypothetical protein ACJX0J_006120, partial [Zea mays]
GVLDMVGSFEFLLQAASIILACITLYNDQYFYMSISIRSEWWHAMLVTVWVKTAFSGLVFYLVLHSLIENRHDMLAGMYSMYRVHLNKMNMSGEVFDIITF